MEVPEWKKQVETEREQKDKLFKMHPQSPVSLEQQRKFKGLDYYYPDSDYRIECQSHEHKKKGILKIEDTQGSERVFFKRGEFKFKINGTNCQLQSYKNSPEEDRLFVPFRDTTSGKETYGAGRYLDLEPQTHQIPGGKWMLDFNQASNPWCADNKEYACPFVSLENWLKVEIQAGEKTYEDR
jgi:uncharacterized protein (DUF1684 family)